MKKIILLILLLKLSISSAQLNGIYTIGGASPNYATINDAVLALTTSGINGSVIFNIRPGIYNEKIIIPSIAGSSISNSITFQSELLDSSSVKIINNSNLIADNYVFYLNGADFITIKHLALYRNLNSANGCRIVRFENSANSNNIENCHLKGKNISSSSNHELVFSTNSRDTNNVLKNNTFENGYYGISYTSTSGQNENGNNISNNVFTNVQQAINVWYFSNISITSNTISAINGSIALYYGNATTNIINNNIISTSGGTGIYVGNCTTPATDSLKIYGNMVSLPVGIGISIAACNKTYIYHNSILTSATNVNSPLICSSTIVKIYNNIIKNLAPYPAIKYTSCSINADYNILYTPGPYLISYNSNAYGTVSAWSAFLSQDIHSVKVDPSFISNTNLHIIGDIYASNNGANLSFNKDLDSDLRTTTPDIGADEFEQPDNDAGISEITNIISPMCSGSTPVFVKIRNYGESSLTQATINWAVNGVLQAPVLWTGNLNYTAISPTINIGNINIIQNQTYSIKVWTTAPNNLSDPLNVNDTISADTIITRLSGNYTIGGVSPSYSTITAAINDLALRGVCSPIIFNIRPGNYIETINLPVTNGASNINTITFQSQNHDSTSTKILQYDNSTAPGEIITNAQNASYYTFKQLTISRLDDPFSNVNNLVNLNKAKHIKFQNCVFRSATEYTGRAVNFSSCSYISVSNCLIEKMQDGITIYGNSSPLQDSVYLITNNYFKNITRDYLRGIYIKDSLIIKNNVLYNDSADMNNYNAGMITGAQGILFATSYGDIEITSNTIIGLYNVGMWLTNLNGKASFPVNVSNNFLVIGCATGSQTRGIELQANNYFDFIHNSIRAYSTPWYGWGGNVRAVINFNTFPGANNKMLNNCIESDSSIYFFENYNASSVSAFTQFDYNNFYIKYPSFTQMSTWAGWPGTFNINSTNFNPMYLTRNDLHTSNPQLVAGIPTYITNDIDGDIRGSIPTMGADEYNSIPTEINVTTRNTVYKITPNPANTFIKISYQGHKTSTIHLISMDGKIVLEKTNYMSGEMIDLSKYLEGLYTISVRTETENHFSKIVIIK